MADDLIRYLPTFVIVADELSFSAAARRLEVTPAAVSKLVRTLERGIGARLFQRSTHALTLTDEGERLRRRVGPLLEGVAASLSQVMNLPETPRGVLRIAAPYGIGKNLLLPHLPEFRRRYPEVELDLRLEDRTVDLVKEGIDVSISIRLDPSPGLIGKRLKPSRALAVASAQFLAEHGTPNHPSELAQYPCVRYRLPASGRVFPWQFTDPDSGSSYVVDVPTTISCTDQDICALLAAEHQGIALLGLNTAQAHLQSGALVEVLRDYSYALPPMSIFYTSKEDLPSRVRAFIDFAAERLSDAPNTSAS